MRNRAPGRCDGSLEAGFPAIVKARPKHALHGNAGCHCSMSNAGNRFNAIQNLPVVRPNLVRIVRTIIGHPQPEG